MPHSPIASDEWSDPDAFDEQDLDAFDGHGLDAFRYGQDTIREIEVAEVGDVTDRSLLHLRCRSGLDTLSWARHGASYVVGIDSSEPAVEAARELAADLGLGPDRAAFVAAGLYDAAVVAPDTEYDIVHTGAGTLSRLPDLRRWAETAASLVAPGGFLHLAEFHPLTGFLDDETGERVIRDYVSRDPFDESPYEDPDFDVPPTRHPIGEVVTAVADAGLHVDFLHEHDISLFQRFGSLEPRGTGPRRPSNGGPGIPLLYSLGATKL
ncbi:MULTISPECIES: bifunctional 2-polyprenyl-6-hydroxyphenol methylase/3-demethylubiquinol 3-O-methyltransferase UbiG [Streptomyces]|uniref:Class I SAM-dependent methyltransferase n=1 Tax=Streptomyces lycii TaxID=2654337 RepID=A0ABQ7FJK6_9ACTN|nr:MULTISPECIES: class I SAM-dependent methyltransferase [Streptomyces]KAF4408560.1 class I SAM-dependent methyltransferase [Streptomyces lycii]PGH49597.1 SAM-dependent methyltransferase [Streptomyces sp. Ru87]